MNGLHDVFLPSALILVGFVGVVSPHGYLLDPPQRSSLWRVGFKTVRNYDDNALNCGGQWKHHGINNGKCGLCGDAYDAYPRNHEIGGKFYTGIIARSYTMNSVIWTTVRLTTYHKGYFEFRLCPEFGLSSDESQKCLNRNLLSVRRLGDYSSFRFFPKRGSGDYVLVVSLPEGITCDRCLFQWRYVTGKDWNSHQEWFVNCADISIYDPHTASTPTSVTSNTTTSDTPTTSTSTSTTSTTTTTTTTVYEPGRWDRCVAVPPFSAVPGMQKWCRTQCPFLCPRSHCYCP